MANGRRRSIIAHLTRSNPPHRTLARGVRFGSSAHPAFDEQEQIIYHNPTSPATQPSQAIQNVGECQENRDPHNCSRDATNPYLQLTPYSGNVPKCPQMSQKRDSHRTPLCVLCALCGESGPNPEEARPIAEMSQNVPQCHKNRNFTYLPSASSAPSAGSPPAPST